MKKVASKTKSVKTSPKKSVKKEVIASGVGSKLKKHFPTLHKIGSRLLNRV